MDEASFTEAIRRLEGRMYRTAVSMLWNDADAADAMQECILKAWLKHASLRDPACFDGWLMRILINECRNLQRRRRHVPLPLEEAVLQAEAVPDTGVRDALKALPEQYRLPLVMHHLEEMDLPSVAHALHLPVSTVKGRLFRARKMLQALLHEEVD